MAILTRRPFGGEVHVDEEGRECVWGRGAIDLKHMCCGWLEALEDLLRQGHKPRRTLFLGLGHDEEVGGVRGAQQVRPRRACVSMARAR